MPIKTDIKESNSQINNSDSNVKIGLLGGSFDPVHNAHIELAKAAHKTLGLSKVELIPARSPWQKADLGASPKQRLDMLSMACENHHFIEINQLEINRSGPTYTIDTLQLLNKNADYYWIMGSDQLANFCSWHKWQDIIKYVTLAVAKRPNSNLSPPAELLDQLNKLDNKPILEIPFNPVNISSTKIRDKLANNIDCSELINARVLKYINKHKIYQSK